MKFALTIVLAVACGPSLFGLAFDPPLPEQPVAAMTDSVPDSPSTVALNSRESPISFSSSYSNAELARSAAIVPTAMVRPVLNRKSLPITPRPTRTWIALAAMQHTAAAFDAWTTRRAVQSGARELNPLLKPVAGSSALYPALQIMPLATDYMGWSLMRSRRPVARRLWWLPQVLGITGSTVSSIINARNVQTRSR